MSDKQKYRSRFSTKPKLYADGKPVVLFPRDLTDLDISMLRALASHRVLNVYYIAALVGSSPKWIRDRFSILKSDGNNYVGLVEEQANNRAQYITSRLFFELLPAGISALKESGIDVPRRYPVRRLKHQVMTDEVIASWRIGFNERPDLRPIWWDEIIASDKTPKQTRDQERPHAVPISFRFNGKMVDMDYVPDSKPHGVMREDGKAFFVLGTEIDCDSESIWSDFDASSSIKRKVLQQIAILDQDIAKKRYGFPNVYFPYYAPTFERLASIMDCVEKITAEKPSHRRRFLFARHPTFTSVGYRDVHPTGWALTADYKRVGYGAFNFTKGGEIGGHREAEKADRTA